MGSVYSVSLNDFVIGIRLEGDLLIAYTDGVTEAIGAAGEEFGEERLRALVTTSSQLSARSLAEEVIGSLLQWQRGNKFPGQR